MRIRQSLSSSLLRSEIREIIPSHLRLGAHVFVLAAIVLPLLLSARSTAFAGSATWKLNPGSGDWNTATNWTPATVPNGPGDTATFDLSNTTTVSIPSAGAPFIEVNGITFDDGASGYTIVTVEGASGSVLTISGLGILNNSGITQNFIIAGGGGPPGLIFFGNSATAGSSTTFTNGGYLTFSGTSTAGSGVFITRAASNHGDQPPKTIFSDDATADNGIFTNLAGANPGTGGGVMQFSGASTAGNGIFTNDGGTGISTGGWVGFYDSSTADNGTFTNNGGTISGAYGGSILFTGNATADSATLIANGGSNGGGGGAMLFSADSTGGAARVEVFGNGNLDISAHNVPGVTIGSIEGSGAAFLGANSLTVGKNNLSTTFSGVIQDGGSNGGTAGSITKIGTGTLTLSGANTYTGGTTISKGTLLVKTKPSSGTGSGKVAVNIGTLGGTGTIGGVVTVGKGNGSGAFLSPGISGVGTLTMKNTLTFKLDGTYKFELKSSNAKADKVVAKGVTIRSGAQFSFADLGSDTLPTGTVFTAIRNTAATPISGTFSNLPDGSTFTEGSNTFQANYEGGDGNDLTLTVLP